MVSACLCLLLASGASWDASLRLEVRTPSPSVPEPGSPEVEADPSLTVRTEPGEFAASASYTPRFVLGGVSGSTGTALHLLRLEETLRAAPRVNVQLEERASYGTSIISLLGPASTPGTPTVPTQPVAPELLPAAQTVRTVGASLGINVNAAISERLSSATGAAFALSGGIGETSRAVVPLQHGPLIHEQLDYEISRIDTASFTTDASESLVGPGQRAELLGVTCGLHHRFSRELRGDLSAGVSLAQALHPESSATALGAAESESAALPLANASVTLDLPDRILPMTLAVHATNTNAISPLTIGIYQRAQGDASLELRPTPDWLFSAQLLAARAYGSLSGSMAQSDLRASWRIARPLQLLLGVRTAWLASSLAPAGLAGFEWTAYLAVSATESGAF